MIMLNQSTRYLAGNTAALLPIAWLNAVPGDPEEPGVPDLPSEPGEPTIPDQPPPAPVA